jgi:hypothetical protein
LSHYLKKNGFSTDNRGDTIVAKAIKCGSVVDRYPPFLYE